MNKEITSSEFYNKFPEKLFEYKNSWEIYGIDDPFVSENTLAIFDNDELSFSFNVPNEKGIIRESEFYNRYFSWPYFEEEEEEVINDDYGMHWDAKDAYAAYNQVYLNSTLEGDEWSPLNTSIDEKEVFFPFNKTVEIKAKLDIDTAKELLEWFKQKEIKEVRCIEFQNFIEEEKAFENNYDPDEFYPPYDLTEEENNLEYQSYLTPNGYKELAGENWDEYQIDYPDYKKE